MNSNLLQKTAEFTKVALREIGELKTKVASFELEKQAKDEKFARSLNKAAEALYSSDFLTDDSEKQDFVKRATEDPAFMAGVIEKVCNAADVAQMGSPGSTTNNKTGSYDLVNDPVAIRAFGWGPSSNNILDD